MLARNAGSTSLWHSKIFVAVLVLLAGAATFTWVQDTVTIFNLHSQIKFERQRAEELSATREILHEMMFKVANLTTAMEQQLDERPEPSE